MPDFSLIPEGVYTVEIVDIEETPAYDYSAVVKIKFRFVADPLQFVFFYVKRATDSNDHKVIERLQYNLDNVFDVLGKPLSNNLKQHIGWVGRALITIEIDNSNGVYYNKVVSIGKLPA
jgi:hypothetical protein